MGTTLNIIHHRDNQKLVQVWKILRKSFNFNFSRSWTKKKLLFDFHVFEFKNVNTADPISFISFKPRGRLKEAENYLDRCEHFFSCRERVKQNIIRLNAIAAKSREKGA